MQKILKLKIMKPPILIYIFKYIHLNKTWNHREGTDSLITPNVNNRYYRNTNSTLITTYDNATFKNKSTTKGNVTDYDKPHPICD